jgi:asparagine synthase (glutamine-hydrolysing)
MCGIAGFATTRGVTEVELTARVRRMACCLEHRGPDDSGEWVDAAAGVAFGHRRLAVVDLSPEGHQPMLSTDGRWVITFNGEVYNFADLRRELELRGHAFRGHSDTEVMLAAVRAWGLEAALQRFIGMFAFAIWDRDQRTLYLARDRLGIKPLYYGWARETFLFASELKAIRTYPDFDSQVDRGSLGLFLRFGCIPQPHSIYQGIRKLPPGSILSVAQHGFGRGTEKIQPYWSLNEVAKRAAREPFKGTAREAAADLDQLLRNAIRQRMIADVPLGAFLSGGIDSSVVVALMQAESSRSVKTFTIGFHDTAFNEACHAKAVAAHLGTDHTEAYITADEALAVVPKLPLYYDEPFADSSQIPTYLVSALARRHVTVALSGDGGDELFGGYERYTTGPVLWRMMRLAPYRWRSAPLVQSLISKGGDAPDTLPENHSDAARRVELPGACARLTGLLAAKRLEDFYFATFCHWADPASVVQNYAESPTVLDEADELGAVRGTAQRLMFFDTVFYLPDDILAKLDRASMAVSLESRVPLLDHRVVEFAARLPRPVKIRAGRTKRVLRQVLAKYVPPRLTERPKMGFSLPIGEWLRGPLKDWAAALLNESRLRSEGFFKPAPIRRLWLAHQARRIDSQYQLWDVLMFQAWWEHWGNIRENSAVSRET